MSILIDVFNVVCLLWQAERMVTANKDSCMNYASLFWRLVIGSIAGPFKPYHGWQWRWLINERGWAFAQALWQSLRIVARSNRHQALTRGLARVNGCVGQASHGWGADV